MQQSAPDVGCVSECCVVFVEIISCYRQNIDQLPAQLHVYASIQVPLTVELVVNGCCLAAPSSPLRAPEHDFERASFDSLRMPATSLIRSKCLQ
jgi:hypothetical protein